MSVVHSQKRTVFYINFFLFPSHVIVKMKSGRVGTSGKNMNEKKNVFRLCSVLETKRKKRHSSFL